MVDVDALNAASRAGDWPAYFLILGGRQRKVTRADLELPAPEHTSNDPWPEWLKVPTGPRRLAALAESLGWSVRVTYARGHRWGVGARMVHVHSVAVRLAHADGAYAVALWEAKVEEVPSWIVSSAYSWRAGEYPRPGGVEDVKALVSAFPAGEEASAVRDDTASVPLAPARGSAS